MLIRKKIKENKQKQIKITKKERNNIISYSPILGTSDQYFIDIDDSITPKMCIVKLKGDDIVSQNEEDQFISFSNFMVALKNYKNPLKILKVPNKIKISALQGLVNSLEDFEKKEKKENDFKSYKAIKKIIKIRIDRIIEIQENDQEIEYYCFLYFDHRLQNIEHELNNFNSYYNFIIDHLLTVEEINDTKILRILLNKEEIER